VGILLLGGASAGVYFSGILDLPPPASLPTKQAVHLHTIPAGASLWVNGKLMPKKTPLSLALASGQRYNFKFELATYQSHEVHFLASSKKEAITLSYTLKAVTPPTPPPNAAAQAHILLSCKTEGASLSLQSEQQPPPALPTVPCQVEPHRLSLPPGQYTLRAQKEGFQVFEQQLTLEANTEQTLAIELQPEIKQRKRPIPRKDEKDPPRKNGKDPRRVAIRRPVGIPLRGAAEIRLTSEPSAAVRWRGKKIGTTPLTHRFPAGNHQIIFESPKLLSHLKKEITVQPNIAQTVHAQFGKGTLRFVVRPWADVFINGKKIGQTPLPPYKTWQGIYNIELKMKDQTHRKMLNLKPNKTETIRYTFESP
jgi:hypothetical protein